LLVYKLFPARESLVSDIPAGDGKTTNFFYSVGTKTKGGRLFSTEQFSEKTITERARLFSLWRIRNLKRRQI
jgi:hypothetical protein